jgi:hypothetical protein
MDTANDYASCPFQDITQTPTSLTDFQIRWFDSNADHSNDTYLLQVYNNHTTSWETLETFNSGNVIHTALATDDFTSALQTKFNAASDKTAFLNNLEVRLFCQTKSGAGDDVRFSVAWCNFTYDYAVFQTLESLTCTGTATTSGALSIGTELQGSISVTGTCNTADLGIETTLAGSVSVVVTSVGNVDRQPILQGSIVATSSVPATNVDSQPGLVGTVSASATVPTADLTVVVGDVILEGDCSVTASVVGLLDSQPGLAETIFTTVTVTGFLDSQPGLVGTSAATATPTGNIERERELQGNVSAAATVPTATLGVASGFTLQTDYWLSEVSGDQLLAADCFVVAAVTGSLSVDTELAGTVSATATITGDLFAGAPLEGTSTATSTTTGSLSVDTKLEGTVTLLSIISGAVEIQTELSGGISSSSFTAGDMSVVTGLAGTVAASTVSTGGMTAELSLAGQISATATPSGDASILTPLAGTVSAIATVTGLMQDSLRAEAIASSTITGSLSVLTPLAGTVSVASITTGDMDVSTPMAGTVSAVSVTTGNVEVSTGLSGQVSATATITGDMDVGTDLAGTVSATATPSGDLQVLTPLAGTVSIVSTVVGDLVVSTPMAGTCSTVSTVTGDASILTPLAGTVSAVATVTGVIADTLRGDIVVVSTVTGSLDSQPELIGTVSAVSVTTGDMDVSTPYAGTCSAVATVTGNLEIATSLSGTVSATVTVTGTLKDTLLGHIIATATVVGGLNIPWLDGEIVAISTTTGDLYHYKGIWGEVSANATVTGEMKPPIGLQGEVTATATPSGNLQTGWYGVVQAGATVTGRTEVVWSLKGTVSAEATLEAEVIGGHVSFRGYCPAEATLKGFLGATRGYLVTSWIPTEETGTINILNWVADVPMAPSEVLMASMVGPVTTTPGLTPFETLRSATMPVSYKDDFYNRIHIFEKPIVIGAITGDLDLYVDVWNTFDEEKTLTDVIVTGDPLVLTGQNVPYTFVPLWWERFQLGVAGDGPPSFYAEVDFDFGATPALPVQISGTRIALLHFKPQRPIRERLSWKTKILTSYDGTEQRIKIRKAPRQKFQLKLLLDDYRDTVIYDMLLHRWQKLTWGIPVWSEYARHSDPILSSDTVISVDTTFADYRDDSFALIWQSNGTFTIVSVETKTDTELNLAIPVGSDFTGEKIIMPMRLAKMISRSQKKIHASGVTEIGAQFLVTDNELLEDYVAPTTYDGLEVVTIPSFIENASVESSDGDVFVTDYETGLVEVHSKSDFNKLTQKHIWYNDRKEACWNFRQFIHNKHGRQVPFLVPTFRRDLILANYVGPSDTYIYIQKTGLASQMGFNDLRTYVGFIVDGVLHVRKIVSILEYGADKERMDIDAALGLTIPLGTDKICLIDRVRFTSDDIDLEWLDVGKNESRPNLTRVRS